MSPTSFFLVPGFEQLPPGEIRNKLDLVESIVAFSQGHPLDKAAVGRISEKLGLRMGDSKLFAGGSSVLFAWSFPIDEIGAVVVKPYYSGTLTRLLIHYFTQIDYLPTFRDLNLTLSNGEVFILSVPQVVAIAKIETLAQEFPTLLVEEALGESIHTHPALIRQMSQVARQLAQKGIIIDVYPSNWKLHGEKLAYVDLLSSNELKNLRERITWLVEKLESKNANRSLI